MQIQLALQVVLIEIRIYVDLELERNVKIAMSAFHWTYNSLLQYLNLDVSASNDRACAILKISYFFETTETYRKLIIVAKFKSASYFLPIGLRSIN